MTLSSTTNKVAYAGNGSTTSFAVTFIYWEDSGVKVILSNDTTGVETTWVDGTQYTLSGGDGATGTLTIDTSPTDYTPASGETLTIKSNEPDTQTSSLPLGGSFPSTTVEKRLDKNVRLTQQLQEELDRTVKFNESSTITGKTVEDPVALNLLRWNSAGGEIEGVSLSDLSLGLGTATKWNFDSSTTMADPGTGDLRLNHATLASVTQIAVDATSAQSGNPDISDWVASWDDSSNDAVRGHLMIHEDGTPANFWVGYINGPITDNTGWLQIPVTHTDSGGSFTASDSLVVSFSRAGDAGAGGFDMLWDADTADSDSGAGKVWFNNGTLSSVSIVYIDDLDSNGVNINTLVDTFDDSTTTALRGTLKITKKGTPATYAVYNVNGAVTSASTYSKVAVSHVISNGTFTDADPVYMEFFRTGNIGIGGISMAWETTTTDTDQGAGKCWANNGTLSSATVFYMDDADSNSADVNAYVDTWDDSSGRPIRGTIIVRELASPANFVIFNVTGAVTSASTYSKIAVTHVATGGSMTDGNAMSVEFYKAGNAVHSGLDMLWDSDTSDSDSGAGKVWFNNGTLSSVSVVYVDDVDENSTSINSYIDSLDDSTNRSIRGTITVKKKANEAVFAKYNVTGAVTSASTYSKIAVTHVVSAGSFSDGDYVTFQFDRAGDAGVPSGLDMLWDSETSDTDSGAGKIYFNNGTLSSVTVVYVDDVDVNSTSINSYVDSWDDSTNLDLRGTITVKKKTDTAVFAKYNVTGAVTSASTYSKVAVTHAVSAGSFTDADPVVVDFVRSGDRGPNAGFDMTFETTTTDTDQGAGKLWLNHGTVGSASVVYLDDVDDNAVSINSFVDSFDDSGSSVKGHIQFEKQFDPTVFALFNVTGAVTSASTYSKVASTYVTGAGSFSDGDKISVTFIRAGDKGDTGSTGLTGISAGLPFRFNSATTDSDKDAGDFWYNNSVGSATIVYLDDADSDGNAVSAITDTWDDGGSATHRGYLFVKQDADPSNIASFKVTGSIVDASGYSKVTVALLVSNGTISNNDLCHLEFAATGTGGIANRTVDTMTGDASDTTLALSQSPGSENNVSITFDGVMQHHDTYSLSGSTITFGTAPATGVKVEAVTGGLESIGTPSDGTVTLAKMTANSVDSDQYVDGSIDLAHLSADCVNGTKIADDSIDSEHYVDGSIDNAHIADNAIDSEHYAAASIDAEHLAVGKDGALSLDATPDSDHTANGPQTSTLNAGYSSTIMDLVYLNANGKWLEADADATGTSINLLGIAMEAKTDGQAMNVALAGSFVRDDTWNWTIGVPLYVSGTLGAITATKPSGSGDIVRTVGYAVTADVIFFNPSSDYVTLA